MFLFQSLPADSQRGLEALYAANEVINTIVRNDFASSAYEKCKIIASNYFSKGNHDSQHIVHAIGHCHIDSGTYCGYIFTGSHTLTLDYFLKMCPDISSFDLE